MEVTIQDNLFLPFSIPGMGGMPCAPSHFTWKAVPSDTPARFYTDFCMRSALGKSGPRIGWLVEAPPYAQCHYDWAMEHESEFDYILTYVKPYVERGGPWLFYPRGGAHVPVNWWGIHPKRKLVSMLASFKNDAEGHKMRHTIQKKLGSRIDVLGSINGTYISKLDGIAPYYYSIVVEAERNDWSFSDHLIDCLALGTIPIYWGCPEIDRFFDASAIYPFDDPKDLPAILDRLSIEDYYSHLDAIRENLRAARQYRVPEDWLWEHYRFLFGEEK
jgi:hypothetical protein